MPPRHSQAQEHDAQPARGRALRRRARANSARRSRAAGARGRERAGRPPRSMVAMVVAPKASTTATVPQHAVLRRRVHQHGDQRLAGAEHEDHEQRPGRDAARPGRRRTCGCRWRVRCVAQRARADAGAGPRGRGCARGRAVAVHVLVRVRPRTPGLLQAPGQVGEAEAGQQPRGRVAAHAFEPLEARAATRRCRCRRSRSRPTPARGPPRTGW